MQTVEEKTAVSSHSFSVLYDQIFDKVFAEGKQKI